MGRKRRVEEQVPEQTEEAEPGHRPRRGRRLAVLVALVGGAVYVVRRNQRKAELDEGIWHEAPTPTTPTA